MRTLLTVLGISMLLISCQVDSEFEDPEQISTADSQFVAKNGNKAAQSENQNTSEETAPEEEAAAEEQSCETLFARATNDPNTCFIDEGFNRWGWTIGPLSPSVYEYEFELFAGAGQCDTDKGTLVGYLTVSYPEGSSSATVEYTMLDGFTLSETHLYIGSDPFPTDKNGEPTVAPGQYPDQNSLEAASSDSYTVNNLDGNIYVIAHGVVCSGDGEGTNASGGSENGSESNTGDGSGDGNGTGGGSSDGTGDYTDS